MAGRASAYDCDFAALAEELGLPLVTNDRCLVAFFPKRTMTPERYLAGG